MKIDVKKEKEPDAIIEDEYQKEGHTVLELRFPDKPEGWAAWKCIVDKIKKKGTPIGVRCEEIEPGKMRGTISEK